MKDVGIFYGHLVLFTVFSYILWTFGIVRGNLVYYSRFGILNREKSGNPCLPKWQIVKFRRRTFAENFPSEIFLLLSKLFF
jgi:hypothetical protein